eukprot:TRINITY_DN58470_c0_g2_i2.p1 TRINITY_DN58470_c0_g2~~TRINITY_DN58470_c0_g2_i2.p1  ORF type:complete len:665 (+),score=137.60 TRINITY_DN58470_c0_g2_i2:78-2072(+)
MKAGDDAIQPKNGEATLQVADVLGDKSVQDYWGLDMTSETLTVNSTTIPADASAEHSARILVMLMDMQEQLDRMLKGQAEMQHRLGNKLVSTFSGEGDMLKLHPDLQSALAAGFKHPAVLGPNGREVTCKLDNSNHRECTGRLDASSSPEGDLQRQQTYSSETSSPSPVSGRKSGGEWAASGKTPSRFKSTFLVNSMGNRQATKQDLLAKSRNAFDGLRTVHEDKTELGLVFEQAEQLEHQRIRERSLVQTIRTTIKEKSELVVDTVIGVLIIVNAIFIGISMDATSPADAAIIFRIDVFFSCSFITELVLKIYFHGPRQQFCGPHYRMNLFDATLIAFDVVQLSLQIMFPSAATSLSDLPSASLFRVVRLIRIVRILRLLRHPVYHTLLMMLHGMAGGLPALGWALMLFIASVYIVALLCREVLGRQGLEKTAQYFDNVPRAMITTFRCSFGDCADINGTPLFEHISEEYGLGYSAMYCVFAFSMSIGMFNVISAIFVESTLAAASGMKAEHKKKRLQDNALWATRISTVVRRIVDAVLHDKDASGALSDNIDRIYDMDVPRAAMDEVGADPVVQAALEELDVDPEDYESLSDILDVDENGSVLIIELLQAIKRLRGSPRRSDIVRVDLVCRSIQATLKDVSQVLRKVAKHLSVQLQEPGSDK